MPLQLPKGIEENVFQYRLKDLLRKNGKPFSGKPSVYERIDQAIQGDDNFLEAFHSFIVDEISNGRNKQIFICNYSIESLRILGSLKMIQSNLASKGLPFENFNGLLDNTYTANEMVYLNIEATSRDQVNKISMCFMRESPVEMVDGDGELVEKNRIDYVWIDIFPNQQYLTIKTRPYTNNYMINLEKSKQDFEFYWKLLRDLFGITYTNMSDTKNTLYKIFKVLTEKAEAPYADKVASIFPSIEQKITELSVATGPKNHKDPVDIPNRVARLFERALILSDITNYKAYDRDKLGIVDRIDFSDQSGAKVNALSGEDGIEFADIYFDTRETLDELQQLNKLWATWFLPNPTIGNEDDTESEIERVETRLEVYENRVVIHFLEIMCAPKEVQDHVLSLFRKFEEGEIS